MIGIKCKWECPSCGSIIITQSPFWTKKLRKDIQEPERCACGRKGKFRLMSKELVDAQGIVLEEVPDQLDVGEQPKRINILLKKDLVSPWSDKKTNPGTKINIVGVLKELPKFGKDGTKSTSYDLIIEANHTQSMEEAFQELSITEE